MGVGTPVRTARSMIAAIEESIEGTAGVLAAAVADIKPENISFVPSLPFYPRAATSASLSQWAGTSGGPRFGELAFEVGIAGSGTAGTAPSWGRLLKGCGFKETLVAATSATYLPRTAKPESYVDQDSALGQPILYVAATTGFVKGDKVIINEGGARQEVGIVDSVQAGTSLTLVSNLTNDHTAVQADIVAAYPGSLTLGYYVDGLLLGKLHGARGNPRILGNSGEPGKLAFTFRGVYNEPTDADLLTGINYESTIPPAIVNGSMTLDGVALKYKSLELDLGNALTERIDPSALHSAFSVAIARREPSGSIDPEMLAAATYNFFNKLTTNSEGALTLTIGAAAGNITTITAPKIQYGMVAPGDRDGLQTVALTLRLNRNSSDDEIQIVCT